jgi:hypothetical protein
MQDITERKRTAEALALQNRELAGGVAYEINNPMGFIQQQPYEPGQVSQEA